MLISTIAGTYTSHTLGVAFGVAFMGRGGLSRLYGYRVMHCGGGRKRQQNLGGRHWAWCHQ